MSLFDNPEVRTFSEKNEIMRTAFLTAYPKLFTDIPYAREIFFSSLDRAVEVGISFQPRHFVSKLALEIESRHKSLSQMIRFKLGEINADNVTIIELASGLSPRRCEFSNVPYWELDLDPIAALKSTIYSDLKITLSDGCPIGVDLSRVTDLERAWRTITRFSPNSQLIIVSEGLFWYLESAELRALASSIHKLLLTMGGVWITADCPTDYSVNVSRDYKSVIAKSSNRDMNKPFVDYLDFKTYFTEIGFSVSRYSMDEWVHEAQLYSPLVFSCAPSSILDRIRAYSDLAILEVNQSNG